MRRELQSALKGKSRYRRFSLGLSTIETDPQIFRLSGKKVTFNQSDSTISKLDWLLGSKWDILKSENVCQFVTQVSVWQTKDGYLSGSARTAIFREEMDLESYRTLIINHLTAEPPSFPEEEEEEEEEESNVGMLENGKYQ